jgi:tryptophanyl-tRNA synthetase
MHKVMSAEADQAEIAQKCTTAAWGCSNCKEQLMARFDEELAPLRERRAAITDDEVRVALEIGATRARAIATRTMADVRAAMGLGSANAFGGAAKSAKK